MRVVAGIAKGLGSVATPATYRRNREHRLLIDALTDSGVLPPDLAEMAPADDAAQSSSPVLECTGD